LLINQESKSLLEAQLSVLCGFQLCTEFVSHSVEFHAMEFLDGLLIEHSRSFL
jgi:hypothetical protein